MSNQYPNRLHAPADLREAVGRSCYAVECPSDLTAETLRCALAAREVAVGESADAGWTTREVWRWVNLHDVKLEMIAEIVATYRHRSEAERHLRRAQALAYWVRVGTRGRRRDLPAYLRAARDHGAPTWEIAWAEGVANGMY